MAVTCYTVSVYVIFVKSVNYCFFYTSFMPKYLLLLRSFVEFGQQMKVAGWFRQMCPEVMTGISRW